MYPRREGVIPIVNVSELAKVQHIRDARCHHSNILYIIHFKGNLNDSIKNVFVCSAVPFHCFKWALCKSLHCFENLLACAMYVWQECEPFRQDEKFHVIKSNKVWNCSCTSQHFKMVHINEWNIRYWQLWQVASQCEYGQNFGPI